MIVRYEFEYWGEHGRCYQETMEEFDSIEACVSSLGWVAFYSALDDKIDITKIRDADITPEELLTKIQVEINRLMLKQRIGKLKEAIQHNEQWLQNVHAETDRRTRALAKDKAELLDLEQQPS